MPPQTPAIFLLVRERVNLLLLRGAAGMNIAAPQWQRTEHSGKKDLMHTRSLSAPSLRLIIGRSDSMTDILVDPTDRYRGFVVVADVAHELAGEILYRSEDTSRNNVALNLGKPNFDLVEPTGVGRGVVDPNSGIGLEEFKTLLVLCALKLSAMTGISRPVG